MKSGPLEKPFNITDTVNNDSNFKRVVDDDLGYWREKEVRIKSQRINFYNFFDDVKGSQNAYAFESKPEAKENSYISDDELPKNVNFKASDCAKNKETYGGDECSKASLKDHERELLERESDFGESYALDGSDDFDIEDNCTVNTEDSDENLLGENPDIPCVPTLDADFDPSLYSFEPDGQDGRGRSEWEAFDFEPDEFEEEILPSDLDKVDTDIDVSVDDRARQMALHIAEEYGWNRKQTEILADVFKNHGWSLTRNRIINELKQGMKFYEFQFAVELREIWQSHTEYSIGYFNRESYGDNSLKYRSVYKNPGWSFCLKIIRRFDSIPGPEEMEKHLDSLYNIWKSSVAIQNRYNTFYGFIRDAVDAGDNFSEMQAWQFLH